MEFEEISNPRWKDLLLRPKKGKEPEISGNLILPYSLPKEGKILFQDLGQKVKNVSLQDKVQLKIALSSKTYGNVWSTEVDKWPLIKYEMIPTTASATATDEGQKELKEPYLSCACVCLFVQDETKEKEVWLVAVHSKGRPYLMNISGYAETKDKTLSTTARREVLEETGIDLKTKPLKYLCTSSIQTQYYNLNFKLKTGSYVISISTDELPDFWNFKELSKIKQVQRIEILDNDEIDQIVLIPRCLLMQTKEMEKIGLGVHHLLISQTASGKVVPVPPTLKSLEWA